MKDKRIFTINPGSTSTKIALFEGDKCLFSENVAHDAGKLKEFKNIVDQFPYREATILDILNKNQIDLSTVDAFVGRGGGLLAVEGGTYIVNDLLLKHAAEGANGISHPAQLGSLLADKLAKQYGRQCFVVNPPDTDELQDKARMTGIKDVYRNVHLHALNLKETAIRHSNQMGKQYEESNYIVCHLGGGVSVSAHCMGRMIDGNDIVGGEGPMAPTRCGAVPVVEVLKYMKKHQIEAQEMEKLAMKTGGFVSWLGTADAREIEARIAQGDKAAQMVWETFIYQVEKYIGAMACVFKGKAEGILLSGGMVHSKHLVQQITEDCSWIAPVYAYPGEFEMEAMAAGAIRILDGLEIPKEYTGIQTWQGFDF